MVILQNLINFRSHFTFMTRLKSTFIFICLCLVSIMSLKAQNSITNHAGARGVAMGNASVTFQDINSVFANVAGLAHLDETGFVLFSEQRFNLKELSTYAAGFALPTNSGTFGLQIQYFGFEQYNEQKIGLAYSRKLLDRLSIGAQVNYLNFSIPEYGNNGTASFELGIQSNIIDDVILGVHISNPIGQDIVEDDPLPTVFKIGIAYCPSKKVTFGVEVEKDIDFKSNIKIGIEYILIESLALRVGFGSEPNLFSFGAGYAIKNQLFVDFGANYHQTLGFSPGLSLRYLLLKN